MGYSVIAHDISERRAAQRALEASQRGLAEAQRIARLGSFEFEPLTGQLTWSEEYYRLLGLDLDITPSAALFMTMVHPDDVPRYDAVGSRPLRAALRSTSRFA